MRKVPPIDQANTGLGTGPLGGREYSTSNAVPVSVVMICKCLSLMVSLSTVLTSTINSSPAIKVHALPPPGGQAVMHSRMVNYGFESPDRLPKPNQTRSTFIPASRVTGRDTAVVGALPPYNRRFLIRNQGIRNNLPVPALKIRIHLFH